jgi:hypothetical protein
MTNAMEFNFKKHPINGFGDDEIEIFSYSPHADSDESMSGIESTTSKTYKAGPGILSKKYRSLSMDEDLSECSSTVSVIYKVKVTS